MVLGTGSALSMKMFSKIIIWRFQLIDDVWRALSSLKCDMSLGVVHVIDIILVLMSMETLPVVLVLEDFR